VGKLIIESTVPPPGLPGELDEHRVAVRTWVRMLINHSVFLSSFFFFFLFFDRDIGSSVCMREVSSYGPSCCWIILFAGWRRAKERRRKEIKQSFCILTRDNLNNGGGKVTLKCMATFNDRDSWPSCLFRASVKWSLSSGLFLRSSPPQDPHL